MRLGYFADGPWAHEALYKIIDQGHEVCFITPRYDTQDVVLKKIADQYNIPWIVEKDVNSEDFVSYVNHQDCDVLVSMSFNQIIKKNLIKASSQGFINCHAGALPFYRGRNPINWALINGEKKVGVTVHYVDEGIDTGDIIIQDFIEVASDDDYGSLLKKGFLQCADSLSKALLEIQRKDFQPLEQRKIHPVGFYCSRRVVGDEYVDWSDDAESIHNLVRAITYPAPGARTRSKNHDLIIYKSRMVHNACSYKGVPGEVVGVKSDAWVIKTGTSVLEILKNHVEHYGDPVNEVKLKIGDRIGLTYSDLINAVLGERK
ncbi:methionyl-tRNA formyltransferase [Chromohalobacter israelensis]|uniref:methionyl-tRNA formyltransferase n=1 Tax=Chromohalobacter israelensis TaxID=141390 RepID=UPI001CC72985|nr:methionyl-tRNA formyltransferase [Chromohalobacter salexigens]MBZ5876644.1 methionyl-tRNA formyltransferase [Chromohalobacter salexigens]